MDLDRHWLDEHWLDEHWPLPERTDLRDRLRAAYDDPGRGYHDLLHLTEVLARLDELGCHDDAVVLAAWFHDAVYDDRPAPEDRSAQWAERELAAPLAGEVARLVRLTETHRPAADDLAGQLLCDADLAILAAGPERYAVYTAGVRREYAHVPDDAFRAGRRAILEDLLAKPTLFHSAAARERWEQRARDNVARELAQG